MASLKQRKITRIIKEFVKAGDSYDITGIELGLAKYFWRETKDLFNDLATGDYRIDQSNGRQTLIIVNQELLNKAEAFQVGYVLDFTATKYETQWNVDINTLKDRYNQLVDNTQELWEYIRKTGFISDDTTIDLILPQLDDDQLWYRADGQYKALSLQDFRDLGERLIEAYVEYQKELFELMFRNARENIINTKDNSIKELQGILDALNINVDNFTGTKKAELQKMIDDFKAGLETIEVGNANALQGYQPMNFERVEPTIADLIASKKYKVGDVVEVLGYYSAGDGAGHLRQKKAAGYNGADAVIGTDGSIWGIVHSGEINVSWLGVKGDGVSDDSLFLQGKLQKFTKYIFDKNALLKTSIDVLVGVNFSGKKITVSPSGMDSVFKLSRKNNISIDDIYLSNNYNGFIFEINGNHKARIEALSNDQVNFPKLEINIQNTNFKDIDESVRKTGYIMKMYSDGLNFGFYGGVFKNLNGSTNIEGFLQAELYKTHTVTTSWITGMVFDTINFNEYYGSLFKLINVGSDYPFEIWNFTMIQSQVNPDNSNMRVFDFQKCAFFNLKNIVPWDWVLGKNKPFRYESCENFVCDSNYQGGLTFVENVNSKLETFTLPNSTRHLSEVLDLSKKVTYNQLLGLTEGKYSLNSYTEFDAINCNGSNRGILEIEYDFERKIAIWTVYFRTNGIQFEDGKSVAFAVIDKSDTNTNFNSEISSSVWKHSPKKSQLYKDVMMRYGDVGNRPDISQVENGFLYISDIGTLNYKIENSWGVINLTTNTIIQLDTPYHASNMQKLGILDSYHQYLTDLHEYEKSQNAQSNTGVMNLNVIQPPTIPTEVEAYAKEYNLI